jgi:hypothetical protein
MRRVVENHIESVGGFLIRSADAKNETALRWERRLNYVFICAADPDPRSGVWVSCGKPVEKFDFAMLPVSFRQDSQDAS